MVKYIQRIFMDYKKVSIFCLMNEKTTLAALENESINLIVNVKLDPICHVK